jgi:hypothetical protein
MAASFVQHQFEETVPIGSHLDDEVEHTLHRDGIALSGRGGQI